MRGNTRRYRQLGLEDPIFVKSQKTIRRALEANGPLTRAAIKRNLEKEGIPAEGQQLPYLLQRAALDGLICQGPQQGSEPTYVLLSDWVSTWQTFDRTKALGLLAARYLASHGPATPQDLAWWTGLPAREARLALETAPDVVRITADDIQYWSTNSLPPDGIPATGQLLPPFDEYLLGYKERSLTLDPAYASLVNAGGGMLKPTVMVNGEILGIWGYTTQKQQILISIQPFRELTRLERELIAQAADRFGIYKSIPAEVKYVTQSDNNGVRMDPVNRGMKPYALKPGEGWTYRYGIDFTVKAGEVRESSGAAFLEYVTSKGEEPPDHTHATEDEMFYVLEGGVTFRCGQESFDLEKGSFIFLPRGIQHGYTIRSEAPVRLIVVTAPVKEGANNGWGGFVSDLELGQGELIAKPPQAS
jgi:quercetin dioxygenase-like cupin family protein